MWTRGQVSALVAAFSARLLSTGCVYSWGIFYPHIQRHFRLNNFDTSLVFSLLQGLTQMTGLVVPMLMRRLSSRQTIIVGGLLASIGIGLSSAVDTYAVFLLCFGLLQGIGQGLIFVTVPIAASFILPADRSHVAISLHNSGDGVGMLLFPIFFELLLTYFNWRSALLITAGAALNIIVCGLLLKVDLGLTCAIDKTVREKSLLVADANATSVDKAQEQTCLNSARCRAYLNLLILSTTALLDGVAFSAYCSFLPVFLQESGFGKGTETLVMSITGAVSILGRLLVALLNGHLIPWWSLSATAHLVQGAAMLALAALPCSRSLVIVAALFVGLSAGVGGCLLCCVCREACAGDDRRLPTVFAGTTFVWGVGSLLGPALAGSLKDWSNLNVVPIGIGAGGFLLSGCVMTLFVFTTNHRLGEFCCRLFTFTSGHTFVKHESDVLISKLSGTNICVSDILPPV